MFKKFQWTPARLTGISFVSLIALGAFCLFLPAATTGAQSASFVDALFTAVSSVCVTGLTVQDTPTYFSLYGQIVILLLIQLGGLGIMTLSVALPVLFGKKLKVAHRSFFQGFLEQDDYLNLRRTLVGIIKYTFIIESVGAILLSARWYSMWGDLNKAVYFGIFHSISAFCNAGFVLFSNNLTPFRDDPVVNLTIMCLIILGGIGFFVLRQLFSTRGVKSWTAHTKITLVTAAIFIILPAVLIFFTEFSGAFLDYSMTEKVWASFFQSVTARTAGFNTMDVSLLGNGSIFLISMLMFIGAAPGGTGGGVKATTVGLLLHSVRSLFQGREQIEIFGRTVPARTVTKAVGVIVVSVLSINVFMLLLMFTEDAPFKVVMFEVVSAFGTVGLSLGLTAQLSLIGKFAISLLMFIGRIGPLTVVFLIGREHQKIYYKYPEGKIMVG